MILVFDIGATRTRVALADQGKLSQVVRLDTDRSAGGFAKFLAVLEGMAAGQKIRTVVGSFPGQLAGDEGALVLSPNLPHWVGMPVRQRIESLLHCPVHILNDVVLGGLGEAHDGAGITEGVMAYFTISTGVNAVRIVDGEVDETISQYEIGQQLVMGPDGGVTTWESLTGGAAMEARLGKRPQDLRKDKKVWQQEAKNLSLGLYNTLMHWTPEVVVFGGSMMRDIDLQVVKSELERLPKVLPVMPRLEYSKLADAAGLHGALAWHKLAG